MRMRTFLSNSKLPKGGTRGSCSVYGSSRAGDGRNISNLHPSSLLSRLYNSINHSLSAHTVVKGREVVTVAIYDRLNEGNILIVAERRSWLSNKRIAWRSRMSKKLAWHLDSF